MPMEIKNIGHDEYFVLFLLMMNLPESSKWRGSPIYYHLFSEAEAEEDGKILNQKIKPID